MNVNLVRKWLVGRELKRTGIAGAEAVTCEVTSAPALLFLPVDLGSGAAAARTTLVPEPLIQVDPGDGVAANCPSDR